jgi:hypothetical protein
MTVSVIEVREYGEKSLAQRINEVIRENNISRDKLIDIKYTSVYYSREGRIITSALIIFEKENNKK